MVLAVFSLPSLLEQDQGGGYHGVGSVLLATTHAHKDRMGPPRTLLMHAGKDDFL